MGIYSDAYCKYIYNKELAMKMRYKYVVPRARMVYTGSKSVAELRQAQVVSAQADNNNNSKQEEK